MTAGPNPVRHTGTMPEPDERTVLLAQRDILPDDAAISASVAAAIQDHFAPSKAGEALRRFADGIGVKPEDEQPPTQRFMGQHSALVQDALDHFHLVPDRHTVFAPYATPDVAEIAEMMYAPGNAGYVQPDHHFTVEWTDFSKPEVLHSASASAVTGLIKTMAVSPVTTWGAGDSQAGVGFRVQSKHHLARMTVTPQFSYKFNHLIYRERYGNPVNARGEIQMVVTHTNPKTGFSNVVHTTAFTPLWITEFGAAGKQEESGSGTYSLYRFGEKLSFQAIWNALYTVVCFVKVTVQGGPGVLSTGIIECDIPLMWLEQEKLV